MIRKLIKKDKTNFLDYTTKYNSDFYIYKDGKRNFLNNLYISKKVFNKCIKSNYGIINEVEGTLLGIALLLKEKDRTVLKILVNNSKYIDGLLQYLQWNYKKDFYIRIKKNNFIYKFCINNKYKFNNIKNFGFKIEQDLGKEIIFKYISKTILQERYKYVSNSSISTAKR